MKDYSRPYPLFSLCGLNCGLCPMHLGGCCPGCGGGEGHQSCAFILRCSRLRGSPEFCFQCGEYPCGRLAAAEVYDSFLPHRNMCRDLDRARCMGLEAYRDQLEERRAILEFLLARCNDDRRKSFFCLASNLLETEDLRQIRARLEELSPETPVKALASLAVQLCQDAADRRKVVLKLHKKPQEKP